jgi:tetratricopeptide (TPR) repeat protein
VEGDVLACAPELQKALHAISADYGDEQSADLAKVSKLLAYLLDTMVRRCLIFRLHPARVDPAPQSAEQDSDANKAAASSMTPETTCWRFTTHRFMQRAIFRKLHAPHVELHDVDQFSLSMWATQPDDVPRPNHVAAQQVADLMAEWTGFPADPARVMKSSAYHGALAQAHLRAREHRASGGAPDPEVTLPARMLRASYGVVRTLYSVGVVSHFHDFVSRAETKAPWEGYFEQHRLQVRWLIERARDLGMDRHLGQNSNGQARAPFFAEEVVWLYNECGLFALVQGKLDSAAGLFDLALRAARRIEGTDAHGALWCRINLNLAVVDIERGRIREARKNLQAIYAIEDENPILRLLVRGYLALIEHYSGNATLAKTWFSQVIDDLDGFGQSRSVAIFSRHLAELFRLGGEPDKVEAVRAADRAIAAATKGGHEDVRQLARLTRVRLAMDGLLPEEKDLIAKRLEEIESYAIDMGMPRLIADIAYARASYLLKLGETGHATRMAFKSISIAAGNGLKLRQMTSVARLGRICEARGLTDAARQLLGHAFEMAESSDYSNVRASVRRRHG